MKKVVWKLLHDNTELYEKVHGLAKRAKEENYIIFRKDANQMSVGAYALSKDEFKACAKQMEELGANK